MMTAKKNDKRRQQQTLKSANYARKKSGSRKNANMLKRERESLAHQLHLPQTTRAAIHQAKPRAAREEGVVDEIASQDQAMSSHQRGHRLRHASCLTPPMRPSQGVFTSRRKKRERVDRLRRVLKKSPFANLKDLQEAVEEDSRQGEVMVCRQARHKDFEASLSTSKLHFRPSLRALGPGLLVNRALGACGVSGNCAILTSTIHPSTRCQGRVLLRTHHLMTT
jgi:hypothetical protein